MFIAAGELFEATISIASVPSFRAVLNQLLTEGNLTWAGPASTISHLRKEDEKRCPNDGISIFWVMLCYSASKENAGKKSETKSFVKTTDIII